MTRINIGIPPSDLVREHLIAEHREIKRVPNLIKKGRYSMKDQPLNFTLGKGHVKFFYDKLLYLKKRYIEIYDECINRGYNVSNYSESWDGVPEEFLNDYTPTDKDIEIIKERIKEKLSSYQINR